MTEEILLSVANTACMIAGMVIGAVLGLKFLKWYRRGQWEEQAKAGWKSYD